MIRKIRTWWHNRKLKGTATGLGEVPVAEFYTREQMEKVYAIGHSDGKREGLAIAKQQALASVREILRQQNK